MLNIALFYIINILISLVVFLLHFIDIWLDDSLYARKRKKGMDKFIPEKRKRPVTVSGICSSYYHL